MIRFIIKQKPQTSNTLFEFNLGNPAKKRPNALKELLFLQKSCMIFKKHPLKGDDGLKLKVGLMNDAFPPTLDGTCTTILNYANTIYEKYEAPMVITPWAPGVTDHYPYEVYRYDSFAFTPKEEYRIGWPFRRALREYVAAKDLDILHFHTPLASAVFAELVTREKKIPMIATYHTKYDYDVRQRVPGRALQDWFLSFIVKNISCADEVWAVSEGAGENLRKIGYQGDYVVMPNGVDFPRGRVSDEACEQIVQRHHLPNDIPVFLFVGRMMWYKNIRLMLDALKLVRDAGQPFRLIMVGKGGEEGAIDRHVHKLGLSDWVIRTGKVSDRELLRAYYSRADLFLFPSTFDTHGIVVHEAAACGCPSLLVRGSSSSLGIPDGVSGFTAEETPEDFARAIRQLIAQPQKLKEVGQTAMDTLYLSWEDAVTNAYRRYENLCANWPHPLPCHTQRK